MTIMDKKWSALPVPYAIEDLDRVRKERYFDPDFYQMEAELLWPRVWQMACRLEEIPNVGDCRRVRNPRPVGDRHPHRRGRAGLPQRLPSPRGAPGPGQGFSPGWIRLPVPRLVLRDRRPQHPGDATGRVLRAQSPTRGRRPGAGPLRDLGWLCLDQPRRLGPTVARVHRTIRYRARRLAGRGVPGGVVVRLPPPGQLEAGRRGVRGAVPRPPGPPPAAHPESLPGPRSGGLRPPQSWSRANCSICGRCARAWTEWCTPATSRWPSHWWGWSCRLTTRRLARPGSGA